MSQATDLGLDVLKWWQGNEQRWPNLCKMVRAVLAAPATPAGVERIFSAAGRMHGDEQKKMTATFLEFSLFACHNTRV